MIKNENYIMSVNYNIKNMKISINEKRNNNILNYC